MTKSFDVFLSHNSKDKAAVRALAEALHARGLKVWLDEWELVPGRPWQEALEEIIETTRSSAVLVGKDGLGPWQDAEMRGCLSEFVERELPVIPVLLPGSPEIPKLPFFLKRFTWVDLRGGLTEEGIGRLQWGITGKRPDRSKPSSIPVPASEVVSATKRARPEARPASTEVKPAPPEVEARAARSKWKRARKVDTLRELAIPAGSVAIIAGLAVGFALLKGPLLGWMKSGNQVPLDSRPSSAVGAPPPPEGTACTPGKERTENGILFVRICPGTFTMGSESPVEGPAHKVTLSEFWIGKTEVTNAQYRRLRPDQKGKAALPVTAVTWTNAKAACESLGGRLPTEAEWEYAARAGNQNAWSFGKDATLLGEYAWYDENSDGRPHAVGMKKANDWGLHDMHGNVWEWVADWYSTYPGTAQTDPSGPATGLYHVIRGGSYHNYAWILRSTSRNSAGLSGTDIGFRCVRGPGRASLRLPA